MKLQLKNIKHSTFASQETNCYQAVLFVDGKKFGVVSNEGYGGPDNFYPAAGVSEADVRQMREWIAANEEGLDMTKYNMGIKPCDLELWCGRQLDLHIIDKQFKRHLKKVLIAKDGKIYSFKAEPNEINISRIAAKYPNAQVLNTMAHDAALSLYMKFS